MKTIKQNIDKRNFALKCFLFVFILIYLGIFLYLNLMKYAQHVDSDIAAEALLAREIWTEKDLTPDNWISSTERRVVGMPTVMALFYGVFHSMTMAAGIIAAMPGIADLSPLYLACTTAAVAGGATVCSHFNDSGFWLVKSLVGMDEMTTLKTWTIMETLVGGTGFVVALVISFFA